MTVPLSEIRVAKMIEVNHQKYSKIIDGSTVLHWIGWVWLIGEEATEEDYKKYPVVVKDEGDSE